jgi:hypothetical protein
MSKIVPIPNQRPARLLQTLHRLEADADYIVARGERLGEIETVARQQKAAIERGEWISELLNVKPVWDEHDEATLARCIDTLARLDPPESYEDDDPDEGVLRREIVGERLAMLIGAYPNGAPSDPDAYVAMLLEEVAAIDGLMLPALDAACRDLRRTQKFLPAISEVVDVLKQHRTTWIERLCAIREIKRTFREAAEAVEALRPLAEAAAKQRAVDRARHVVDGAHAQMRIARDAAIKAQHQSAAAAQDVTHKLAALAKCEAEIDAAAAALARLIDEQQ